MSMSGLQPDATDLDPTAPQEATLGDLPHAVMIKVLQHVPLRDRLGRCALVQRSWHLAAAAATRSITVMCSTQAQADRVVAWLQQHGQHVTRLVVATGKTGPDGQGYIRLGQLPCPNLVDLQLSAAAAQGQMFELPRLLTATGPTLFSSCSSLQRLVLRDCIARVEPSDSTSHESGWPYGDSRPFYALSSLPALTSLHLSVVGDSEHLQLDLAPVLSLTNLRSLVLVDMGNYGFKSIYDPDFFPQHSRAVKRHQEIQAAERAEREAAAAGGSLAEGAGTLPQAAVAAASALLAGAGATGSAAWPLGGLTHLCIAAPENRIPFSMHINTLDSPNITKHTALKRLEVRSCDTFGPDVLDHLTQLEHLVISSTSIDWGPHTVHGSSTGSGDAITGLLLAMGRLQQLRRLELVGCDFGDGWSGTDPPAAAFSGLTASSKLETLKLPSQGVPAAAWEHVFPPGRQLPHLTELEVKLAASRRSRGRGPDGPHEVAGVVERLRGVADCCPALRVLAIKDQVSDAERLAPLLHLAGRLVKLSVGGKKVSIN